MPSITDKIIGTGTTSIIAAADWKTLGSPVTVKNESTKIITLTISGADPMELDPGEPQNVLPGQIVTGTAPGGAALLQLYQGIIPSDESAAKGPGASTSDPLYVSADGIATVVDRLDRLIVEMKINNAYNHRAHGEEITARDLGVGLDYLV